MAGKEKGALRPVFSASAVEWRESAAPVAYPDAVAFMEERAALIRQREAGELVWLLEHPPIYTAGTSAGPDEVRSDRLPVHRTGRGGRVTYHGPGQRVAYLMLDLEARGPDLRRYVRDLERWVIGALARLGVAAVRREGRVGLWVVRPDREDKIAAIGVRVRRWVSYHGVSINVDCDLGAYAGIVPCGIADPALGVTSLRALGSGAGLADLDRALKEEFPNVFG
jgi:lipoyl(octanoyl) transferase